MRRTVVFVLFASAGPGCADPCAQNDGCSDVATPASQAEPSRWPAPPATWADSEVSTRLEGALAWGVVEPWGLAAAWFALFEHTETGCPSGSVWFLPINYGGCTTADGWHYAGTASFQKAEPPERLSFELSQDCEITAPDGDRYYGSGTWGVYVPTDTGSFTVKASGMYGWPAGEGMLRDGYSVWVDYWGELTETGGSFSLGGVLDAAGTDVSFDGVEVDTDTCPGGTGTIGLRDPSGGWYTLALDPACDGCGVLAYDGVEVGTTCVDLAPVWAASLAALRPTELPWP